eukprot:TRINITY_DN2833_c0_g1_i3.p1 TRINITY_DN2833_c0_g1~~TRINITY_DN2833_c0_g1_i3.p1  ORF type:complete len:416 (+),score=94.94 TRINITY_DN2833_c0_g1_i3:140-1387(+)
MCIRDSPRTMCSLSQCAELLSGVIHGAERVGDQNSETLQHVIQLMTSGTTPIHGSSVRDVSKRTEVNLSEIKPCKIEHERGLTREDFQNMLFSVDELSMLLDAEPEFTCADPDSPASAERAPETPSRKRSRDEGCNDEAVSPACSILDCCSDHEEACTELAEAHTDHTSKRVKLPLPVQTKATKETEVAYAAELVQMSFDAMARINHQTGEVIWANNAFGDLTTTVGRGNPLKGLQALQRQFLQELPRGLCSRSGTVSAGTASIDLWSATQFAGGLGEEIVLWTVQRSMHRQLARTTSGPRSCSEDGSLNNATFDFDKPFPEANEFVDLRCEMKLDKPSKGKPPVQLLWRKYGQKSLLPPPVTPDSAPHVPKDRLYYKCTQKDCCAKLRVDVDRASGEHVSMIATGTHCHHIVLV